MKSKDYFSLFISTHEYNSKLVDRCVYCPP